jgi:hypothetical protein
MSAISAIADDGNVVPSPDPGRRLDAPVTHRISLSFIDGSTGQPTTVRAGVFDRTDSPIRPYPWRDYLFQYVQRLSYFYCANGVGVWVPAGPVTIHVMKGFEYHPELIETNIQADTAITVTLTRWIDMRNAGWFSGETHTHMTHSPNVYDLTPQDLLLVMEGEDLNFLNSMDAEEHFTGGPHPLSTPQRTLYFSREYRNPHFGHISLLGLEDWVSTEEGCWDTTGVACGKVLNSVVAGEVHAQTGAMLVVTHPFPTEDYFDVSSWPGGGVARGIPIDLVDGSVDAIDILCYSHIPPPEGLREYTQALNAGFRIPASAGTDAVLSGAGSFPPGGYRVYAKAGTGPEDFSPQAWIDAVREGRSFVTNSPIIESFTIDGHGIGAVVSTHQTTLTGFVSARCAVPMARVDIVAEGAVVATLEPPTAGDGTHIQGTFNVRADSSRWVAARVTGTRIPWYVVDASGLFAQTNPIYIDYLDHDGGFVHPKLEEAEDHFVHRLSQMSVLFDSIGYFPGNSRAAFDSAVGRAKTYYHGLTADPPGDFSLLEPSSWSDVHHCYVALTTTPTMVWEPAIDHDPGSVVTYALTFGPDSTFVTGAQTVTLSDTFYTVPSGSALTNLVKYYWQVVAEDDTGLKTTGVPSPMSFVVDVSASGATVTRPPSDWLLAPAVPNPFNPDTRIAYAVPLGAGEHSVDVIDARGAVVRTLFVGSRPAGRHVLTWNGTNDGGNGVASGVYFVRLRSARNGLISSRKVTLLK